MRSTNTYTQKLTELEQTLQKALNPVSPDPEFVNELNRRLYAKQMVVEKERSFATVYLFLSFGLFIGVFIFWLIRKIVRANQKSSTARV